VNTRVIGSPYKGLASFEDSELDALLFFGRARETEATAANLQASRLTVLYGPTGVGKSSILRAGVAHRLRKEPDLDVEVLDSWEADAAAALRAVAQPRPGRDLYLILDQFEEYFVYHGDDDSIADALGELLEQSRVNVLIGIRDDSLARLDAFKRRLPELLANRLRLEHLDRRAGEEAIRGPIAAYNRGVAPEDQVEIDDGLVEAVLDEVTVGRVQLGPAGRGSVTNGASADRIEAPFLQLVLERIWEAERAAGSNRLRLETFRSLGGAARIVRDHLEQAMAGLSPAEQEAAAAMYNYLVTPSGTKMAHRVGDLAGYADVSEPEAAAVLNKLVQERILRSSSDDGAASARYEIYHDVLANAVLAWRSRHESERAVREAEARRRRAFVIATAALVALLVVAAIAVFALIERGRERTQARNSHAQQLAADALTKLDSDPEAGLRLALSAALLQPKRHEEEVLRNAFTRDRQRAVLHARGPVRVASFDPSGKRVLAAGDDGRARVYDRSGRLLATFDHGAAIGAAVFAPRGRLLATGGRDGKVKVWSGSASQPVAMLNGAGGAVRALAFDRRAARLYSVTSRGVIRGWSLDRHFASVAEIRTRLRAIGAAFAPSGRFVVVIVRKRFATVYSLPRGRVVTRLFQRGYIHNVAFSPDERLLLTSGHEGTVRLWRVGSWRLVRELRGPYSAVNEAVFSRDGRLVAAASADGTARVWETATGFQRSIMIGHTNELTSVAFNPDASAIVTASIDGTARVWDIGGRPTSILAGHGATVRDATFSPDGSFVATAGDDGTARLWDPGSEPDLRPVGTRGVTDFALTADGRRFVTAGGGVVLWNASPVRVIRRLSHERTKLAAISPDGTRVAAALADARGGRGTNGSPRGLVVVLDARSGVVLKRLRASARVTAVSFDRANRVLIASGDTILIWDGRRLQTRHEATTIDDAATSPNGKLVATAGEDGDVRLRDAQTWALQRTLRGHRAAVNSVHFSANGEQLVTASQDEEVRIWDVGSGRTERLLHWHFGPVADAAISRDGRWVLTAGPTTAGIGLARTAELFRPGTYLRGPKKPLTAVGFGGPAGRIVFAASRDGTLRTFVCDFCGDVHDLIALARRRLGR
jgi:WD40 repeat protein